MEHLKTTSNFQHSPVPPLAEPPQEQPHQPPRRRRRKRKPPYKALAVCAAIIFLLGFLTGFLFRGLLIPEPEEIPQTEPEIQETPPATQPLTNASRDDWQLILVNQWNALPSGYEVSLNRLSNGLEVDSRCYADLTQMLDDMQAQGLSPFVCSAYRTVDEQQELFDNKVDQYISEGYSQEEARKEAGTVVAVPGTSEHHLGLAVDIVDKNNQILDENQEKTPVQQWLMENCWDYGFILRYPNGKSDITGIIYEPWHYRYVGREIAKEIHELNVTLEEYLLLPISQ